MSYFLSRYPVHPTKDFPAPTGGRWIDMMFGLCKAASLADTVAHTLVRPAAFQTSCLEFKSCCSICLFLSVHWAKQLAVWRFPDCSICTFTLKLSFLKCFFLIQSQFTLLGIEIVLLSITKKWNYIDLRRYFFLVFCTLQTHTIHSDLRAFLSISTVTGFSKYITDYVTGCFKARQSIMVKSIKEVCIVWCKDTCNKEPPVLFQSLSKYWLIMRPVSSSDLIQLELCWRLATVLAVL